jgi:hypothetical protein
MTAGIVWASFGTLLMVVGLVFIVSKTVKERFVWSEPGDVATVCWSVAPLMMGYGAQDLRAELGFWVAYGVVFGPWIVLVAYGVATRNRRAAGEAPRLLWKRTQGV